MNTEIKALRLAAVALLAFILWNTAYAYVGPGAGIGVIGTVIAFFGAIFLAVVGFIWYPIKRMARKRKARNQEIKEQKKEREALRVAGGDGQSPSQ